MGLEGVQWLVEIVERFDNKQNRAWKKHYFIIVINSLSFLHMLYLNILNTPFFVSLYKAVLPSWQMLSNHTFKNALYLYEEICCSNPCTFFLLKSIFFLLLQGDFWLFTIVKALISHTFPNKCTCILSYISKVNGPLMCKKEKMVAIDPDTVTHLMDNRLFHVIHEIHPLFG